MLPQITEYNVHNVHFKSDSKTFSHTFSHNDLNYGHCQKMNYLRMVLQGEALKSIRGWSTTDDNYDAAVQHMKRKFGDPELEKQALWSRLMNTPAVRKFDIIPLRKFLDLTRATIYSARYREFAGKMLKQSILGLK
jgi:hypothetical protein